MVDKERIAECNCSVCMRVGLPCGVPNKPACQCAWLTLIQGAYVWIYPPIEDTAIEGREHLAYNVFNTTVSRKAFCRHCGTHICNEPNPLTGKQTFFPTTVVPSSSSANLAPQVFPVRFFVDPKTSPDAEIEELSDQAKAWRERAIGLRPITLRVLDDFDFKTVETRRMDGWGLIKPLYVNP